MNDLVAVCNIARTDWRRCDSATVHPDTLACQYAAHSKDECRLRVRHLVLCDNLHRPVTPETGELRRLYDRAPKDDLGVDTALPWAFGQHITH